MKYEKHIGTIRYVEEVRYEIYFEIESQRVKARDKRGEEHVLFIATEDNDAHNFTLAYEYILDTEWM